MRNYIHVPQIVATNCSNTYPRKTVLIQAFKCKYPAYRLTTTTIITILK
jgi:hypothetical protein